MNTHIVYHQGKTKSVSGMPPQIVQVRLSDNVTVGDGEVRVNIPGKGAASCATAINCFELLRRKEIPISYIGGLDVKSRDSFLAKYTHMVPIEIVCRGIATGSYIKRNPEVIEGTVLKGPVVEFFLKDDANHDPLIVVGPRGTLGLYKPKEPQKDSSFLGPLGLNDARWVGLFGTPSDHRLIQLLHDFKMIARDVFEVLAFSWEKKGFTLVDLKIEVGVDPWTRDIVVSDAITPDEWRLWRNGDKDQSYDKDPFRKAVDRDDPQLHARILKCYQEVADITARFH